MQISPPLSFKNYVYSVRQLDALGKPLIKDDHEVYQHQSGDARLMGGELMVDVHPLEQLHISNTFSYVNSVQLHQPRESKYLPFTPAPRWNFDVRYDFIRDGRVFNNAYAAVGGEVNLRQNHFYAEGGTELPLRPIRLSISPLVQTFASTVVSLALSC